MNRLFYLFLLLGAASPTQAQQPGTPAATVIAVPPLTSPDSGDKGNRMLAVGWDATQLIETDLRQTAEVMPLKPNRDDYYSYPEVTAPNFAKWRSAGAKALVTGFVQSRSDGRLTVGCYVYDVEKGRELARKGFVIGPSDWRRAAHKCSGLAYTAITGAPGIFDTRIVYVAEAAPATRDEAHRDDGQRRLQSPLPHSRYGYGPDSAPGAEGRQARLCQLCQRQAQRPAARHRLGQERPLIQNDAISFAPRFSPDGGRIVYSMMLGANADIYIAPAAGGVPQRLTTSPGVDTDPSFSPDGSEIVFESDRGGSQQIYVMNADGTGQRRISFGGGY